ncbi:MAG: Rrf2 family transcriptional regulator [Methyloceanibacter sp.]
MRLTKQTSYAIRILIHCATAAARHVRVSDIASLDGITEYNVAKIVPLLVRGGFITTNRGRAGGLKLARPASEINLGDVLRVTETTHVEAECVGGASLACGIKQVAPINLMLSEALQAFISVLEKHTLADLVHTRRPEAMLRATKVQKPRVIGAASC